MTALDPHVTGGGPGRAGARVLVVDDSVVVRRLVAAALGQDPAITHVDLAADGHIALAAVETHPPDLIVCDVEMPGLDGVATVRAIREQDRDTPIVMFSSLTERGADITLDALSAGATDYVLKPSGPNGRYDVVGVIRDVLVPRVHALLDSRRRPSVVASGPGSAVRPAAPGIGPTVAPHRGPPPAVVAIGVSTGGPAALSVVLGSLPADLAVPVLVVQHMPPRFTGALARRLDGEVPLRVRESEPGARPEPGEVWIARGGEHLEVRGAAERWRLAHPDGPSVNDSRPSVDVLFRSLPSVFGDRVLGVVLTGMGRDGTDGARDIVAGGGAVLAQDEATSIVWGMPARVIEAGLAERVLPLEQVAATIAARVRAGARR